MAHHKSAKKRIRSDARKNEFNKSYISTVRSAVRAFREAATGVNKEDPKPLLVKAQSLIAKAAGKGLIHKNNASRKISRLTKLLVAGEKAVVKPKKSSKKKKVTRKASKKGKK